MANQTDPTLPGASPIETRQQAYRRMTKIRHRLFWLHPTGLVIALIASAGDAHKLHKYATISLTITIIAHIAWALQMIAASRIYKGQH